MDPAPRATVLETARETAAEQLREQLAGGGLRRAYGSRA
jgi:hypothetical protein